LADKPGKEINNPRITEKKIEAEDMIMVSQAPLTRNFRLADPYCVEGSISYQPQLYSAPLQAPIKNETKTSSVRYIFC